MENKIIISHNLQVVLVTKCVFHKFTHVMKMLCQAGVFILHTSREKINNTDIFFVIIKLYFENHEKVPETRQMIKIFEI